MDGGCLTVAYLESLSTGELAQLAADRGVDIPGGLERVFIIGELLELQGDGKRGSAFSGGMAGEVRDDSGVQDVYADACIDVLVRDPDWVFAFWEFPSRTEAGLEAGGYCLRVVPLKGDDLCADADASLTVALAAGERSKYIGIPDGAECSFEAELCQTGSGGFSVLAKSIPFRLPRPFPKKTGRR